VISWTTELSNSSASVEEDDVSSDGASTVVCDVDDWPTGVSVVSAVVDDPHPVAMMLTAHSAAAVTKPTRSNRERGVVGKGIRSSCRRATLLCHDREDDLSLA
jgi:hypothetical protein